MSIKKNKTKQLTLKLVKAGGDLVLPDVHLLSVYLLVKILKPKKQKENELHRLMLKITHFKW